MKRIGLFLLTACAAFGLASCNNSDVDQANSMGYVTVHVGWMGVDYWFETDSHTTIYPGDKSRVNGYTATEGQRALITFSPLSEPKPNFDINAAIYSIGHFSSSDVRVVTDEAEFLAMAKDPVIQVEGRLLGDWITVVIRHRANTTDASKHEFEMILNEVVPSTDEEKEETAGTPTEENPKVLSLQLRHKNLEETAQGYFYDRYYSFNVEEIADRLEGKEKIEVAYYDGVEWKTVELLWLKESDPKTL